MRTSAGPTAPALGGDPAYQYGKAGPLAGVGPPAAQSVLGAAGFGTDAQALQPLGRHRRHAEAELTSAPHFLCPVSVEGPGELGYDPSTRFPVPR